LGTEEGPTTRHPLQNGTVAIGQSPAGVVLGQRKSILKHKQMLVLIQGGSKVTSVVRVISARNMTGYVWARVGSGKVVTWLVAETELGLVSSCHMLGWGKDCPASWNTNLKLEDEAGLAILRARLYAAVFEV